MLVPCYISTGVEIGIFIEPLDLPSHKLVFFAVNDNDSTDSAGGSHWYGFNETQIFVSTEEPRPTDTRLIWTIDTFLCQE